MAERLTLSRRDAATALTLYEELIASCTGAHGTRALHYRAGRWLEKSGLVLDALPHYQRAFELAPGAGVAFAAIERCARAGERWDVLVDTQSSLAEHTPDEGRRTALLEAAIDNSMRELRDPLRTLEILLEAENGSTVGRFDAQLHQTARGIKESSGPAADFLAQIARVRGSRIEQIWDPAAKAVAMIGLARAGAEARRDDVAATLVYASVLETELAAELPRELRGEAEREYAALQPRKRKKPAADGDHGRQERRQRRSAAGARHGHGRRCAGRARRPDVAHVRRISAATPTRHALLAQPFASGPRAQRRTARAANARRARRRRGRSSRVHADHRAVREEADSARRRWTCRPRCRAAMSCGGWDAPDRDPALVRLTQLIRCRMRARCRSCTPRRTWKRWARRCRRQRGPRPEPGARSRA